MKIKILIVLIALAIPQLYSFTSVKENKKNAVEKNSALFDVYAYDVYNCLSFENQALDYEVFKKGLLGYVGLKKDKKLARKNLLTIIDYSVSSNEERLWIIDLDNKKVDFNTLVAHGKNSGDECAMSFSNIPSSYQSSLGFFTTGEIYTGKHGTSLYLHGQEEGVNDKAFERYIVIHGADYVSESFIEENGRLGRSLGCPAIPLGVHENIIYAIANSSCVFIYYPEVDYLQASTLLDESAISFDDFS
ncbi:MAG: murein L,D-transpeptidase catalytic domain family protein [Bacteroidia bacterium]|nr:murein L,D-transpeptidase catalytic domain family protein [Bacteroidia bacterium]NNC85284.1 murein L,D-transpeptidase catalytic domain family protein [Bacteroidia bacterium]